MFVISKPTSSRCAINIKGSPSGPTSRMRLPSLSVRTFDCAHAGSGFSIASRTSHSCPETEGISANDLSRSAVPERESWRAGWGNRYLSVIRNHGCDMRSFPSTYAAFSTAPNNLLASRCWTVSTSDPAKRTFGARTVNEVKPVDSGR